MEQRDIMYLWLYKRVILPDRGPGLVTDINEDLELVIKLDTPYPYTGSEYTFVRYDDVELVGLKEEITAGEGE